MRPAGDSLDWRRRSVDDEPRIRKREVLRPWRRPRSMRPRRVGKSFRCAVNFVEDHQAILVAGGNADGSASLARSSRASRSRYVESAAMFWASVVLPTWRGRPFTGPCHLHATSFRRTRNGLRGTQTAGRTWGEAGSSSSCPRRKPPCTPGTVKARKPARGTRCWARNSI